MNPPLISYASLGIAIVLEVIATSFLQKSEQFTKLTPTLIMAALYLGSFFFLSQALKIVPLGVAYAIWSGVGIVLVSFVSIIVFRQTLDLAAMIGIAMIIAGVIVVNAFSGSATH